MSVAEPESYYPSCVVNLTLVFESKLQINVEDSGPVPFPETQQLVTPETASTYILNRVPKKCSVNLQGHTQAATYKLVFDYKELPIDPRTVVSCSAEIHLGTVSATDFSEGMQRTLPNGQRRSILRTRTDDNRTVEDNLLMIGPADNWTVEYGTDGAEVHIEGRDLRGVLLDSPLTSSMDVYDELHRTPGGMPSRRRRRSTILSRLNTSQRIDRLVQQILQEHDVIRRLPDSERVRVIAYEDEWPDRKVLSPMDGANLPRGRRGASGQGANAGGTQNNLNFWDVITRYCQPKDALVLRNDLQWVQIGQVKVGDTLLGFSKSINASDAQKRYHKFTPAKVEEVFIRTAPVVKLHMASGRTVRCTPDHHWFTGRSEPEYEFAMPCVGRPLVRLFDDPCQQSVPDADYKYGYAKGILAGDGTYVNKVYTYNGRSSRTKHITLAMNDKLSLDRFVAYCRSMGLHPREGYRKAAKPPNDYTMPYARLCTQAAIDRLVNAAEPDTDSYKRGWLAGMFDAEGCTSNGLEICQYKTVNPDKHRRIGEYLRHFGFRVSEFVDRWKVLGGVKELLRFFWLVQPAAVFKFQKYIDGMRMKGSIDRVVRIEECGEEEVVSLKTSTGTYIGQGYASRNCYLVGAVPRFVGRNLEIRYAPSIFQLANPKNRETPFRPNVKRRLDNDEWNIRRLVYGRDIQSMKISRKYAGVNKPHAIRCVSIDNSSGRRGRQQLLQVVWPPRNVREARAEGVTGNRTAARDAVGGQESQEIRTYRVPAVRSLRQLTQIAQAFYEQIGRQEMTGEVEAARVTSFGGSNADPDMLRLRVGDPIELLVDASRMDVQSPIVSTINASSQLSFSEAVQAVARHLNGNTALARVIVASNRGNIMGVLRYFMVSNVNYDWSYEEVTVKADLQNYIIYRWGEIEKEALNNARQTTAVAQHQRHSARRALNSASATTGNAASNPVDSVSAPAASRMAATSGPIEPATAADITPRRTHGGGVDDVFAIMPSRWR